MLSDSDALAELRMHNELMTWSAVVHSANSCKYAIKIADEVSAKDYVPLHYIITFLPLVTLQCTLFSSDVTNTSTIVFKYFSKYCSLW